MPSLNYKHLYYFWTVAREGSISRASRVLHVTQPALSAQIMEMERHLGVKLVERTRGATLLTNKGQEVLHHVRTVLAAVDQHVPRLAPNGTRRPVGGPLREELAGARAQAHDDVVGCRRWDVDPHPSYRPCLVQGGE